MLAGNAVSFKHPVEILHHVGPYMGRTADDAILNGLESLGNSPQDPEFSSCEGVLGALWDMIPNVDLTCHLLENVAFLLTIVNFYFFTL